MTENLADVAARLEARGCTPEEIAEVEADQGVALPSSYREFLRTMGRDLGGLFAGSDVAFPEILGARAGAVDVLQENLVPQVLPAAATVIFLHQGYIVGFLDPAEGQDPPVRMWQEGQSDPRATNIEAPGLLAWILAADRSEVDNVRHRTATRNMRIPVVERESCPRCATPMQWGGRASYNDRTIPEEMWGRSAMTAHCPSCGSRFWRWADEIDAPLQKDPP